MFPLPLDKFKNWIVNKTGTKTIQSRILPCSDLVVEDVWTLNLPKLTSDSPIRTLDINQDGTEDVIFGFGTGKARLQYFIRVIDILKRQLYLTLV